MEVRRDGGGAWGMGMGIVGMDEDDAKEGGELGEAVFVESKCISPA